MICIADIKTRAVHESRMTNGVLLVVTVVIHIRGHLLNE